MKIFLAGAAKLNSDPELLCKCDYILESYYTFNKSNQVDLLNYCDTFLLDSGAYTFMQNSKTHTNWDNYLDNYINFINKYNIQYFFELDIDDIVGYEKVKEFRQKLELKTNKKSIPVWHISRGKDEFLRMCDEYDYVAIGGLVGNEKMSKKNRILEQSFPWFIQEAHKRNTQIHALGYTSMKGLKKYHFDSVDSTGWIGSRFGQISYFDGTQIKTVSSPEGYKLKNFKDVDTYSFTEWCKFQQYAKTYL